MASLAQLAQNAVLHFSREISDKGTLQFPEFDRDVDISFDLKAAEDCKVWPTRL